MSLENFWCKCDFNLKGLQWTRAQAVSHERDRSAKRHQTEINLTNNDAAFIFSAILTAAPNRLKHLTVNCNDSHAVNTELIIQVS